MLLGVKLGQQRHGGRAERRRRRNSRIWRRGPLGMPLRPIAAGTTSSLADQGTHLQADFGCSGHDLCDKGRILFLGIAITRCHYAWSCPVPSTDVSKGATLESSVCIEIYCCWRWFSPLMNILSKFNDAVGRSPRMFVVQNTIVFRGEGLSSMRYLALKKARLPRSRRVESNPGPHNTGILEGHTIVKPRVCLYPRILSCWAN